MSDDSAVDSTIDLKKRARRRLVGAAALALLAVVLLPIVMDSEPKPTGQEIQIHIPSQDVDSLAARVIPDRPAPLPHPAEISKSAPAAAAIEPSPPAPKPAAVVEKTAISATAAVAPAAVKPKTETPPAKPEVTKKETEAAHAEAVLAGKDAEQWIVQLGAYQSAANVKQLTAKLKDMGVASYTEKFDSPQGPRTRVRAGPFKSRDAAEKARLRIKKIGVDGPVVQK